MAQTPGLKVGIVGGGVIGCSIAFRLANDGVQVTLFEPNSIGSGSTKAAIGGLTPYTDDFCREGLEWFGSESLSHFDDFLESLSQFNENPVEIDSAGQIIVATNERELEELENIREKWKINGTSGQMLTGSHIRSLEPFIASSVVAGLEIPEEPQIDVPMLMQNIQQALCALSVEIANERILAIESGHSGATLMSDSRSWSFDNVVIASGQATGSIQGLEFLQMSAKRGQSVVLKLPERCIQHHVYNVKPNLSTPDGGDISVYVAPRERGRIHLGVSYEEESKEDVCTAEIIRDILTHGIDLFPVLEKAEFLGSRSGLRPVSPDGKLVLGASKKMESITFAVGHWGLGVTLAPITAHYVHSLLVKNEWPEKLHEYSVDRFLL